MTPSENMRHRFKLSGAADIQVHKQAPESGEWLIDVIPIEGQEPTIVPNEVFDLKQMAEDLEQMRDVT